jgi:lipoprotein-anchoring transpeptidase ErfK/SrfK
MDLFEIDEGGGLRLLRHYSVGTPARGLPVFPLGRGVVTRIELDPVWRPTELTRETSRKQGIELPQLVAAGDPANQMGRFKIHLSHSTARGTIYRIHGTNDSTRIGKRATGGCVCMDNQDGLWLANTVSVGTEVNIVP